MNDGRRRTAFWTIGAYTAGLILVLLSVQRSGAGTSMIYVVGYALALAISLLRIPRKRVRDEKFAEQYEKREGQGFWRNLWREYFKISQRFLVFAVIAIVIVYFADGINLMEMLAEQSLGTIGLLLFVVEAGIFLFSAASYASGKQKYENLRNEK